MRKDIAVYTEQMERVERQADYLGISHLRLMDNAGVASAVSINRRYPVDGKIVLVFCGRGNNGGDGFVCARQLFKYGARVFVVLTDGLPLSAGAKDMFARLQEIKMPILSLDNDLDAVKQLCSRADFFIDSVLGTGFRGELKEHIRSLFGTLRENRGVKISVDIPSGIEADASEMDPDYFSPDMTLALGLYKPVHVMGGYAELCGEIELIDIGIPDEAVSIIEKPIRIANEDTLKKIFTKREENSNKGSYGKLLCLCGSERYIGAAMLSAMGAMKVGSGITSVALPERFSGRFTLSDPILLPLPDEGWEVMLSDELGGSDALLAGCGLSKSSLSKQRLFHLLKNSKVPLVLDADGLNLIAEQGDIIKNRAGTTVLTPHPGEASRLLGISIDEIQKNRLAAVHSLAERFDCTAVLKGNKTVIADEQGNTYVSQSGGPALSKAGTGDVLAGMIAGLLAQGKSPFLSAAAAVYLHGKTAELILENESEHSLLASDLAWSIGRTLKEFDL